MLSSRQKTCSADGDDSSSTKILTAYDDIMLPYYVERKENPVCKIDKEMSVLRNKIRYIEFVRDGTIDIFADMSAAEIEEELVSHDFVGFPDFGYLLSMSCGYSFRPEALEKLKAELHRLEDKQKTLGTTTPEKIV